jgi:translation initiation factor 4E
MTTTETVNNHVELENHKVDEEDAAEVVDNNEQEVPQNDEEASIVPSALLNVRHELKNKWTLGFLNDKKDMEWTERLKNVCTFSTVEEFWAVYDNIRPPSVLYGCDYNLFKEGIEPMWEVEANKNGGRLVLSVDKSRHEMLDSLWMELLLALIGEQFGDEGAQICGAVCNIRQKGSKISLWTTNADDDEANKAIGGRMKEALFKNTRFPGSIRYEDHREVQQKTSSAARHKFQI